MRSLVCLLLVATAASVALGEEKVPWNFLSATWSFGGVLSRLANQAFFELPLTATRAAKEGWVQAREEAYTSLWCLPNDPRVCIRYDQQGSVAGLQVSFLAKDMAKAPFEWQKHPLVIADTIFDQDVGAGRYYFVPQEVLQQGGRASFDEIGTGLWLQSGDDFIEVPQRESELPALGWTKENCIPTMGRHYYQNITSTMDCQSMEPYFLTVDVHKNWVHGVGFQLFGPKSQENRGWLESVPSFAVKPTLPNAPQCLVDWAADYGVLSLHVYFRKAPYLIMC
ncbi:hypothetical protein R5R35_004254 [Gryllus longicercus]|uniref:Accessory gland protein n=1 Tax=Gryllus longicercus TaxID=2509291 RepID=A0AAN9VWS1_9ORTH